MDAQADAQAWADAYPDAADYHEGGRDNESWFRAMEEALQAEGVYAAEGAEAVAAAVAEMGGQNITLKKALYVGDIDMGYLQPLKDAGIETEEVRA